MSSCNNNAGLGATPNCSGQQSGCLDKFGCPSNICPDFQIKRFDTEPEIILSVEDCNGPIDLTNTIVEINMWAAAKLKTEISASTNTIKLADNIGFYQGKIGDIIVVNQVRSPELMLISGFDEINSTISVIRGYQGTTAASYKKGTSIKIFRILNAVGETKMVYDKRTNLEGKDETFLEDSQLIYRWRSDNTCLPGCYWLEFKLLKMTDEFVQLAESGAVISSVSNLDPCGSGIGVEWVRRYPLTEGYLVKIINTPSMEM